MQCDLLELRDAHAKLRTTNEKLRREKDKNERERELLRQSLTMKKRAEQEEERQIISVYQLVEELTVLAPDLFPSKPKQSATMPTPPIRRKVTINTLISYLPYYEISEQKFNLRHESM